MEHLELSNKESNNDMWLDNLPNNLVDDAVEHAETRTEE